MKIRSMFILFLMLLGGASILRAASTPRALGSKDSSQLATFAGGCFWCMEPPFEKLPGVVSVTSGYAGGKEKDPTYEQVSYGKTSHAEAVQIRFDPTQVTYAKLLDVYWHNIDPTTLNRSFVDAGKQYRSAIFYHDEMQKRLAEESKQPEEDGERPMSARLRRRQEEQLWRVHL